MHEKARRGDDRPGGDDEHPDAIDSGADDFHELSKIFHERLTCRKARCVSILFAATLAQMSAVVDQPLPVVDRARNPPSKIGNGTGANCGQAR